VEKTMFHHQPNNTQNYNFSFWFARIWSWKNRHRVYEKSCRGSYFKHQQKGVKRGLRNCITKCIFICNLRQIVQCVWKVVVHLCYGK
jgi:hypothetical protein